MIELGSKLPTRLIAWDVAQCLACLECAVQVAEYPSSIAYTEQLVEIGSSEGVSGS